MPRDVYLQPDAPDAELPADVILRLARRHVPAAHSVVAVEESGGEARTYLIAADAEDLILKVQRPHQLRPRTSLEKEVFFLHQIEEAAPDLPVPRVRGYGRESNLLEYTLMTRMPGTAMRRTNLPDAQRDAVLRDLGIVLRRIHSLPLEPFIESDLFPGDYAFPSVQTRFGESFMDLADRQRQHDIPWPLPVAVDEIGRQVMRALPRTRERAALHSNPYTEHVFVDPECGTFIGLIDFGDAYVSHPAFELRRWNRPGERTALLEGYTAETPVSDDFLAVWRCVMILADTTLLVRYGPDAEQVVGIERDLDRLLAEL